MKVHVTALLTKVEVNILVNVVLCGQLNYLYKGVVHTEISQKKRFHHTTKEARTVPDRSNLTENA